MRITTTAEEDSAPALTPIQPRVVTVSARGDFTLAVEFEDGLKGVVDCRNLVFGARSGVFAQLQDPQSFVLVHVECGAVTWPGELDLAPDAMYDAIQRDGCWILQ